ncbi:MAG: hypothetical protein WC916_05155 [Candidatus Woesearchaeota archaeon]
MKGLLGFIIIVFVALFIVGCGPKVNTAPNISLEGAVISSGNISVTVNATEIPVETNTTTTVETAPPEQKYSYKIIATEGDLVTLKLKAVDPDNDKLTYTYTKPFNQNGLWQTQDGDAGKYLITVTVSDGRLSSSADVLVIINPSNKAPIADCPEDIYIKEGDDVTIKCNFFDKENDTLVIDYSGWISSPTYTTNFESSGDHKVFVRVSDGTHNVSKTVQVHVENIDRPPVFNKRLKDVTAVETDIVTLKPDVSDPDNDKVSIKYSEPFDNKGVWKTSIGDAGTYPVSVVASDGTLTTKETFTLTVKMLNTAPVMKYIANITIDEGDTVIIKPDVKDREDDPITFTYSGWMTTSKYETTFDDAYPKGCNKPGCSVTYKVTVTASDGVYQATQDVFVTVKDKNRAPEFVLP